MLCVLDSIVDDSPNLQFDPIPGHFSVTWPWERLDSNEANRNAILTQYDDIQAAGIYCQKDMKNLSGNYYGSFRKKFVLSSIGGTTVVTLRQRFSDRYIKKALYNLYFSPRIRKQISPIKDGKRCNRWQQKTSHWTP